jgi:hypothetical protein
MNPQFPSTLSAARPTHPAALNMPGVAGTAAGLCREMAGRHLPFLPQSEPKRLLLKACVGATGATLLTLTGFFGLAASTDVVPLVPAAFLGLACATVGWISGLAADMEAYERRQRRAVNAISDEFAIEISDLRIELAAARRGIHAVGARQEREGVPAASGEMVEGGGDRLMPSAIQTAKVIRPDCWR